jgi:hypothetical protein
MDLKAIVLPLLDVPLKYLIFKDIGSTDLDIYAVTDGGPSHVHIFQMDERWVDVFIDNEETLIRKMNNADEIIINFVRTFQLSFGDSKKWNEIVKTAINLANSWEPSSIRKMKVMYRINTLASKFSNNLVNNQFILSSLCYHITYLILAEKKCIPESPKIWTKQVKTCISYSDWILYEHLLDGTITKNELDSFISKLLKKFKGFDVHYSYNLDTTFIV